MFITPFLPFLIPLYQSWRASTNIRLSNPLVITINNVSKGLVSKGSSEYNQFIATVPEHVTKTQLSSFLDRMEIRKDLMILEDKNPLFAIAFGTNFFTQGDAIIVLPPNLHNIDPGACYFILKHEISHILHNEEFIGPLISAVCSATVAIFAFKSQINPLRAMLITAGVAQFAHLLYGQYRERRADQFAIVEASVEELKGARRFCLSSLAIHKKNRNTALSKMIFSSAGECRLDIYHPSFASRLKKIELALQEKQAQIDDQEEEEKINALIRFREAHP